jgi:hypothetical protein
VSAGRSEFRDIGGETAEGPGARNDVTVKRRATTHRPQAPGIISDAMQRKLDQARSVGNNAASFPKPCTAAPASGAFRLNARPIWKRGL